MKTVNAKTRAAMWTWIAVALLAVAISAYNLGALNAFGPFTVICVAITTFWAWMLYDIRKFDKRLHQLEQQTQQIWEDNHEN